MLSFLISFQALADQGLNPFGPEYKPEPSSEVVVKNMPVVRSQDSVGICYSFVASTLIDEANCTARKITDCSKLPDDQRSSPLDLTRFSTVLPQDADYTDRFNYEGLNTGGGSPALTLQNAIASAAVVKESCAPFDQFVSKINNPAEAQKLELAMWKRFDDAYNEYKKRKEKCVECALEYATAVGNELKENYNLKASNQEILEAFAEKTHAKFLDKLLIPDQCWDFKNQTALKGSWSLKVFPEEEGSGYEASLKKIKEVLGTKKRPLAIGFCTQTPLKAKSQEKCGTTMKDGSFSGEGHAVVIKGYRRVCNSQNKCYDALQIQNSWGQSWQDSTNGGWVDAKELLNRTFYERHSLSWLEPTK
ncbi:MAG: hypothetical protein OM95_08640 [Bdellovibrio sp. ArHS]|nr:MAG: hypothetical protein OM95_08640 [Bdellovibrio sp. ArHS]